MQVLLKFFINKSFGGQFSGFNQMKVQISLWLATPVASQRLICLNETFPVFFFFPELTIIIQLNSCTLLEKKSMLPFQRLNGLISYVSTALKPFCVQSIPVSPRE